MPINMLVRWEVRGPGGLVEVLVVRLVLDTWSRGLLTGLLIMVVMVRPGGCAWSEWSHNRS